MGVKVTAGRGHGAMAKRGLDEVYKCVAIEGVGGVGVTQPVRADAFDNIVSLGGTPEDYADPPAIQHLSAPGPKYRLLRFCRSAPAD